MVFTFIAISSIKMFLLLSSIKLKRVTILSMFLPCIRSSVVTGSFWSSSEHTKICSVVSISFLHNKHNLSTPKYSTNPVCHVQFSLIIIACLIMSFEVVCIYVFMLLCWKRIFFISFLLMARVSSIFF